MISASEELAFGLGADFKPRSRNALVMAVLSAPKVRASWGLQLFPSVNLSSSFSAKNVIFATRADQKLLRECRFAADLDEQFSFGLTQEAAFAAAPVEAVTNCAAMQAPAVWT